MLIETTLDMLKEFFRGRIVIWVSPDCSGFFLKNLCTEKFRKPSKT
jgi:hypothetical protein